MGVLLRLGLGGGILLLMAFGISNTLNYGDRSKPATSDSSRQASPSATRPLPMEMRRVARCDFNADGHCDAADLARFQKSLGKRLEDLGYDPLADADADGVVTVVDQEMLFPVTAPGDTAPPATTATVSPAPNAVSR